MAGTGLSYGFPEISDLGKLIEDSAGLMDKNSLKKHLNEMYQIINNAKIK